MSIEQIKKYVLEIIENKNEDYKATNAKLLKNVTFDEEDLSILEDIKKRRYYE